jgi:hypothetical protein
MFLIGSAVWILLACWTVSAFWTHIDELRESYRFAARLGALASEVIGFGLLYWHCFDLSLKVRRWALIFSVILASVLTFHAGALRGLRDARIKQVETENRLTEKLTQMSTEQAAGVAQSSAKAAGNVASQKERLALANKSHAQQGRIAQFAQETVAKEIVTGNEKVKDLAIVPRWYLDGWMYGVIFMIAMTMLGTLWWFMSDADDVDENFDGIPDRLQPERFPRRQPLVQPAVQPATAPIAAAQGQPRPEPSRPIWHGGVPVTPAEDTRPN